MLAQLQQAYEASLVVLANAIELRDRYTRGYVERVRDLAVQIAQQMGWNKLRMEPLLYGAILCDIGRIYISVSILYKPGPLDDEEWTEMKRHAAIGADLLARIPFLTPATPIIRHHHEG